MKSEDVVQRLAEIQEEQKEIQKEVYIYNKLEEEKIEIQSKCEHKNAYEHDRSKDDYEGRVYVGILCHDCGKAWEERVTRTGGVYPKWERNKMLRLEEH